MKGYDQNNTKLKVKICVGTIPTKKKKKKKNKGVWQNDPIT